MTEELLTYLVELLSNNTSQKDLYELLMMTWKDQSIMLKTKMPHKSSNKIVSIDLLKGSFESNSDNISARFTNTLLSDVFNQMNQSQNVYLRKLAAYIVCIVTFNNNELQKAICTHFNFTPVEGIVIINQFPRNLISSLETVPSGVPKGKSESFR